VTKREFDQANKRRRDLIDKKFDGGLTADEEVELDRLQKQVMEHLDRKYPHREIPHLEELEQKCGIKPPNLDQLTQVSETDHE